MDAPESKRVSNWKRIIELNLTQCYPQRLNAAFEYLNTNGTGEFTLKDITDKGKLVFSFLCLDLDQDTSFSVMDIFRHFDRTSSRAVNLITFVTGVVELLLQVAANTNKLQSIAMDLTPGGKQITPELLHTIDSSDAPKSYVNGFSAMNYLVKSRIERAIAKNLATITTEMLVNLFKDVLDNVVVEIQQYFHISNEKLYKLVCDFTGGQHNITAMALKANINRNSIKHFKITPLASPAYVQSNIENAASRLSAGFGDIVSNGFLKSRNRKLSFYMATSDGEGGDKSGGNYMASNALHAANSHHQPFGSHDAESLQKSSGGTRRHGSANGPIRRGSMNQSNKQTHADPVVSESAVTSSYLSETDNIASAMEFLEKLGFNSAVTAPLTIPPSKSGTQTGTMKVHNGEEISTAALLESLELKYNDVDSSELYALQNAYKSIQCFLDLTVGAKVAAVAPNRVNVPHKAVDNTGVHKRHDSIASVLMPTQNLNAPSRRLSMNMKTLFSPQGAKGVVDEHDNEDNVVTDSVGSHITNDLVIAQDKLKRLSVRLEILESLQQNMGLETQYNFDAAPPPVGAASILGQLMEHSEGKVDENGNPIAMDQMTVGDIIAMQNEKLEAIENEDDCRFQSIVNEVNALKSSIAHKGLLCSPVGAMLELPSAILPLNIELENPQVDDRTGVTSSSTEILDTLAQLISHSEVLQTQIRGSDDAKEENERLNFIIKMQAEQISELKTLLDLKTHEHNDYLSTSVELQMLREEIRVFRENGDIVRDLQVTNHDLQKQMQVLRKALTDSERKCREMSLQMPKADTVAMDSMNNNHQKEIEELENSKNTLAKDTQRLLIAIRQSEQRTKAALQDQLVLRQRLNKAEEELSGAKAFVTKLLGDIEIEKNQRTDRDELDLKVQELQRALVAKDGELFEARESTNATRKLKQELRRAEEYASSLEEKIGEVTAESEKGLIAIEHLDNYREQLRQKTIEARDMSLQLHSLEAELKEVKQFQAKHKLMEQELNELRIKVEKFPPLIVEITRLRSTAKAGSKTLQEQDRSIIAAKEKAKAMETEVVRYKAEIRSLRDVESKLKDANGEIKKLQALVGEVKALRAGKDSLEEEKKNMESQVKKMRRALRQSVSGADTTSMDNQSEEVEGSEGKTLSRSGFAVIQEETENEGEADVGGGTAEDSEVSSIAARKANLGGFLNKLNGMKPPSS